MDEHPNLPEQAQVMTTEEPAQSANPPSRMASRTAVRRRVFLTLSLLFNCLVCLGVGFVALHVMTPQAFLSAPVELPVTGGDPPLDPTTAPDDPTPSPPPDKDFGGPSLPLTQTYREAAVDRLSICMSAFHDFFLMEELAAQQPEILKNDAWTKDVTRAMNAFRSDCEPLGSLPDAPAGYAEMDRWLKLAAGEVTQAADSFAAAMQNQPSADLGGVAKHLMRFVHYAQNAEDILSSLEERREI